MLLLRSYSFSKIFFFEILFSKDSFDGQTFCLRTMFTGFMVDASNIMKFESVGNMSTDIKYSIEFWIFKPKSNGEQVCVFMGIMGVQFEATCSIKYISSVIFLFALDF